MVEMYPVILLLGGFGSRLKTISNGIPKALMNVGDGVFLDNLINNIISQNVVQIYLSTFYKSELFTQYLKNSIHRDKLLIIKEPEPLGTGGAINFVIQNSIISSPFFVINGDSLSNINLDKMVTKFKMHNFMAMIGISKVYDTERYGSILEKNGKVIKFKEKSISGAGWINNGHYLFKKEIFDGLNGVFSLEKDLLPNLINKGELGSFKVKNDNFVDMGIPDEYNKIKKGILTKCK